MRMRNLSCRFLLGELPLQLLFACLVCIVPTNLEFSACSTSCVSALPISQRLPTSMLHPVHSENIGSSSNQSTSVKSDNLIELKHFGKSASTATGKPTTTISSSPQASSGLTTTISSPQASSGLSSIATAKPTTTMSSPQASSGLSGLFNAATTKNSKIARQFEIAKVAVGQVVDWALAPTPLSFKDGLKTDRQTPKPTEQREHNYTESELKGFNIDKLTVAAVNKFRYPIFAQLTCTCLPVFHVISRISM